LIIHIEIDSIVMHAKVLCNFANLVIIHKKWFTLCAIGLCLNHLKVIWIFSLKLYIYGVLLSCGDCFFLFLKHICEKWQSLRNRNLV
jgi:hypothetical protein